MSEEQHENSTAEPDEISSVNPVLTRRQLLGLTGLGIASVLSAAACQVAGSVKSGVDNLKAPPTTQQAGGENPIVQHLFNTKRWPLPDTYTISGDDKKRIFPAVMNFLIGQGYKNSEKYNTPEFAVKLSASLSFPIYDAGSAHYGDDRIDDRLVSFVDPETILNPPVGTTSMDLFLTSLLSSGSENYNPFIGPYVVVKKAGEIRYATAKIPLHIFATNKVEVTGEPELEVWNGGPLVDFQQNIR